MYCTWDLVHHVEKGTQAKGVREYSAKRKGAGIRRIA